jgi:precorrin-6B methylase 2
MLVEDLIDSRKPASRSRVQRTGDRIVAELTKAATPTFLDVGANIGLMTLNVLASVPSARIHAFEPGPDQRSLLERTIAANRLGPG